MYWEKNLIITRKFSNTIVGKNKLILWRIDNEKLVMAIKCCTKKKDDKCLYNNY